MRLVLMHLCDQVDDGPEEEAGIVIPGGSKTALLVPVEAIDHVAPILLEALDGEPAQRCECCDGLLAVPGPWDGRAADSDPRGA